ncbi:MAG: hypothetical protein ABSB40_13430 [Nitrososphaeria archaeon]
MPSDSIPDKFYDVIKFDNGRRACNSRDYCKHIQRVIKQEEQEPQIIR